LIAVLLTAVAVAIAAPSSGTSVESSLTVREKRADRVIEAFVDPFDREVDIGVVLRIVVRDEKRGKRLLPGKPKLRVLREYELGGVLDTQEKRLVRRSEDPAIWYASQDQERVLFYKGRKSKIVRGSEGAGKSRLCAMQHYLWWLELLGEGREVGQTAPTKHRLKHVRGAMFELFPTSWFRYVKSDLLMTFADGHAVQFVSAKIVSEAQGSPLQGYNFSRAGGDELQDHAVSVTDDLEARGRTAEQGFQQQLYTCTASPKSAFRNLKARKLASGDWEEFTLLIADSPFIWPEFLERMKRVMTLREYERRFLAIEHSPERMLYHCWSKENLRPIPRGAIKVTSRVVQAKTGDPRHAMLAGHDPGASKAATVWLDAYKLPGVPGWSWWARRELFTLHATTEAHARDVLAITRREFGLNYPRTGQLHVRAHPFGQAEEDPSEDLYRIFRRVGLDTRAAQYKKASTRGTGGRGTGLIKKNDRFEMMNRLLCDASGLRRFFVDVDDQKQPRCPKLVEAFEQMERDELGQGETEDKDEHDMSDLPAAAGYGLWPWEKESVVVQREGIADQLREARAA
jgi:hypothetical protein